jgi:hypothetical protein
MFSPWLGRRNPYDRGPLDETRIFLDKRRIRSEAPSRRMDLQTSLLQAHFFFVFLVQEQTISGIRLAAAFCLSCSIANLDRGHESYV